MRTAALFALVIAACVPASEKQPPAGAAGFDTQPSTATMGETFRSGDGWSITIERFVLQTTVSATPTSHGYGNSEPYLFDGAKPARIFVRALSVGPAKVRLELYGRYASIDNVTNVDVDVETKRRFERAPDDGVPNQFTPGPSLLVKLTATKDGAAYTMDVALNLSSASSRSFLDEGGWDVEVPENDIAVVPLPIRAEILFQTFAECAHADDAGDGDGQITGAELTASRATTLIEERAGELLRP